MNCTRLSLLVSILVTLPGTLFCAEPLDSLRVVTINVWSGLDYHGTGTIGEYESPADREGRFQVLLTQLRELRPHIVMLQEANPVGQFSSRLADSLQCDEVHQVCHAGVKFAGLGVPSNLDEGIAILADRSLSLRYERAAKVGGAFGVHGSAFSFHLSDAAMALEGSVVWGGRRVHCINVHLLSVPPETSYEMFSGDLVAAAGFQERVDLKTEEFENLENMIGQLPDDVPYILGGDFNVSPDDTSFQRCVRTLGLRTPSNFSSDLITWDARNNPNIRFTTARTDARGVYRSGYDSLSARADTISRRLDYLFLGPAMTTAGGSYEREVSSEPVDGLYASDHYGLLVTISRDSSVPQGGTAVKTPVARPTVDLFPILSYDTDVGFGYGGKAFFLNKLGWNESFDITVFNSSKGERWYRFVTSFPDIETRQRTVYPLAFDCILDYDKYIRNSFFGLGNTSRYADREYYTREPLELSLLLSRGVTESLVLQGGLRFLYVADRNIDPGGLLARTPPPLSQGIARSYSVVIAGRYDTRNSVIQPSYGWLLESEIARAPLSSAGSVVFTRFHIMVQHYTTLFLPATVLALRAKLQAIEGDTPVQMALSLGGNNTLRGFVQDRFLGNALAVTNAELRIPVFWRFSAVAALDAGNVWDGLRLMSLSKWKWNPTAGIRFSMDTFVVRADVGFGPETTGVYLNFGHIF